MNQQSKERKEAQQDLLLKAKLPQRNRVDGAGDEKGQVKIDFYTDPLCCWSWAFEKPWRQLLDQYPGKISYRYIMCGMIPDWNSYSDPMNSVSKPLQMGPVWMHASQVTQVKMNYSVWHEDPPASSYPACMAVKTAGLQSTEAEDALLLSIRKSLMEDGLNIAKPAVLFAIAERLAVDSFDFHLFKKDWERAKGKDAFRADLQKSKFHNIGRFPTLTLTNTAGKGYMIVGYRPFDALHEAFIKINAEFLKQ